MSDLGQRKLRRTQGLIEDIGFRGNKMLTVFNGAKESKGSSDDLEGSVDSSSFS